MVIHVTPEIEADIRQLVSSGEFADETEVLLMALRLLDARQRRLEEIRASLKEAIASIERGEGREWSSELMAEIRQEADEKIRLGLPPKIDVCP